MSGFPKITGIILAAGRGRRMGRTKQLLPFRGQTILECVVEHALASSLERVVVVLGYQAAVIGPLLKGKNVTIVCNPRYDSGQSSSLKAGMQAVSEDAEAVLFLLGDQPLVTPQIINLILAAYATTPGPIIQPEFAGKRGNPVLFSRETFPSIQAVTGDCGARPLFDEYAGRILRVPVDDPAIQMDIDSEEDYRRLQEWEQIAQVPGKNSLNKYRTP